jgi:predicted O-methyltransferase YrrM
MIAEDVEEQIGQFSFQPLTSPATGRLLYEFASSGGVEEILELGCAHGTSTAYLAAALEAKGAGLVRTFDREDARDRDPNLFTVLQHVGVEHRVKPILSRSSYTWELMRLVEERTEGEVTHPLFDFCFLDGAHTWETDGLAFLLVDRLMKPDRWIVFDDVNWTLGSSPTLRDTSRVKALAPEERTTPHVRKIIDLLVRPLGYEVRFLGNSACAYKAGGEPGVRRHHDDFDQIAAAQPELVRRLALGSVRRPGMGRLRHEIVVR